MSESERLQGRLLAVIIFMALLLSSLGKEVL
jgi:hypothetical protein